MRKKAAISLAIALLLVGALSWLFLRGRADREGLLSSRRSGDEPEVQSPAAGTHAASQSPTDSKKEGEEPGGPPTALPLLSGRVTDLKDQPIKKAQVEVEFLRQGKKRLKSLILERVQPEAEKEPKEPKSAGKAHTDADGRYVVRFNSAIDPGTYRVKVRATGFLPRLESWQFSGEPSTLDFKLEQAGETIEGMVVDRTGAPIHKARVEAEHEDKAKAPPKSAPRQGAMVDRRSTDVAGRFRLSVEPGVYRLTAHAKGYASTSVNRVQAGSHEVRIKLALARSISGRVVDLAGSPVAGAAVSIYQLEPGKKGGAAKTHGFLEKPAGAALTGTDGRFEIADLSLRTYLIEVEKKGYEEGRLPGKLPQEGEVPPVEIRLKTGGLLSGTVTDQKGTAVAGAMVALRDEQPAGSGKKSRHWAKLGHLPAGGQKSAKTAAGAKKEKKEPAEGDLIGPDTADFMAATDKDGRFHFDTLARSVYTLSVQAKDFVPYTKPGVEVKEEAQVAVVLDAGLTLAGRVAERGSEAPVAGAVIRIALVKKEPITARTEADGRYRLRGLSEGRLRDVRVHAAGFSVLYEDLVIDAAQPELTHDFSLERAATVAGQVLGPDGTPVAGASIKVEAANQKRELETAAAGDTDLAELRRRRRQTERTGRTDAGGLFKVVEVTAGPAYRVIITHPAYQEFRSDPFSVPAGGEIKDLKYTLRAGARFSVLVLQPDLSPAANARVELKGLPGADPGTVPAPPPEGGSGVEKVPPGRRQTHVSHATGTEGKALFTGLKGGLYTLLVRYAGCQPFRQEPLQIGEDQSGDFTVNLLPENLITGVVVDSGGNPVFGARLHAGLPQDPAQPKTSRAVEAVARAATQADGSFRLRGLGAGPYLVHVSAEGYADRTYARVPVNQTLEATLLRKGAIDGVVAVAESGEPVGRFSLVLLHKRDTDLPLEPETGPKVRNFEDPSGSFHLGNVEPGVYIMRAIASDLSPREVPVRVLEGATTSLRFALYAGIVVSGRLVDKRTNGPVAGADLLVFQAPPRSSSSSAKGKMQRPKLPTVSQLPDDSSSTGPPPNLRAIQKSSSDDDGRFAMKDLPPGNYILVANHPDFMILQKPFDIRAEGLTRELFLTMDSGEAIEGTIRGADNSPVPGALVVLVDAYGLKKQAITDVAGRYSIRGLRPGPYTLWVIAGDGAQQTAQVVIKKGGNRGPDIRLRALATK